MKYHSFLKRNEWQKVKIDKFFKKVRKCKIAYCFYFYMCYNSDIHMEIYFWLQLKEIRSGFFMDKLILALTTAGSVLALVFAVIMAIRVLRFPEIKRK